MRALDAYGSEAQRAAQGGQGESADFCGDDFALHGTLLLYFLQPDKCLWLSEADSTLHTHCPHCLLPSGLAAITIISPPQTHKDHLSLAHGSMTGQQTAL